MRNKCSQQSPVSYERRAHVKHPTATMQLPSEVSMTFVSIDLWIDNNCKRSNSTALPGPYSPHPRRLPLPWASMLRAEGVLEPCCGLCCPPARAMNESLDPCGSSEVLFCCCCGCLWDDGAGEFSIRETFFPSVSHPASFSQTLDEPLKSKVI